MKRHLIASLVVVFAVVSAYVALSQQRASDAITDAASSIVEECAKETDHQKCYERDVPRMLGRFSLLQVFDVIRHIRVLDQSYQFCHVLAHKLGESVVANDPSKWIDAIPFNPGDGLCSNGFIHGVVIGRFRDSILTDAQLEAATEDFKKACEPHNDWRPSSLDQAICYHGLGHLFDYITDANLRKSLTLCEKVTGGSRGTYTEVCKGGVFMQIFQPLEPDDFALIEKLPVKPTAENYRTFCASYKDDRIAHGACLHEAWPLFKESIFNGTGVARFCSDQPDRHAVQTCYETASSIVGRLQLQQPDKIVSACEAFPSDGRITCFRTTAQAVLEEDRNAFDAALGICARAGRDESACLEGLASRARFIFGDSPLRGRFCAALPEAPRKICLL